MSENKGRYTIWLAPPPDGYEYERDEDGDVVYGVPFPDGYVLNEDGCAVRAIEMSAPRQGFILCRVAAPVTVSLPAEVWAVARYHLSIKYADLLPNNKELPVLRQFIEAINAALDATHD